MPVITSKLSKAQYIKPYLLMMAIATPAVGVDFVSLITQLPTDDIFEVVGVRYRLATAANVANRNVMLQFEAPTVGGVTPLVRAKSWVDQPASVSQIHTWSQNANFYTAMVSDTTAQNLPRIIIGKNHVIRSITTNLIAGDQLSEIIAILLRVG